MWKPSASCVWNTATVTAPGSFSSASQALMAPFILSSSRQITTWRIPAHDQDQESTCTFPGHLLSAHRSCRPLLQVGCVTKGAPVVYVVSHCVPFACAWQVAAVPEEESVRPLKPGHAETLLSQQRLNKSADCNLATPDPNEIRGESAFPKTDSFSQVPEAINVLHAASLIHAHIPNVIACGILHHGTFQMT